MADFVKGIFFKTPPETAPEWIKRKVSVNVNQFMEYCREHQNEQGYVNFDLKEAKSKHWYLQLQYVKPDQEEEPEKKQTGFKAYNPEDELPVGNLFPSYAGAFVPFEDDVPF